MSPASILLLWPCPALPTMMRWTWFPWNHKPKSTLSSLHCVCRDVISQQSGNTSGLSKPSLSTPCSQETTWKVPKAEGNQTQAIASREWIGSSKLAFLGSDFSHVSEKSVEESAAFSRSPGLHFLSGLRRGLGAQPSSWWLSLKAKHLVVGSAPIWNSFPRPQRVRRRCCYLLIFLYS